MANNSLKSFASGMIIATSIFTAVYYFQPFNKQEQKIVENDTLTNDEVQAYLKNNGYISIPEETYDELVAKSKEYEAIKNQSQKASEPKPPEQKETVPNPQPPEVEKKTFTLTVKSGMDSIKIANMLENAGIVDSGKKFEQFLTEKDWTRSIQVGTYKLNSSMSYEEIGKIITKKK